MSLSKSEVTKEPIIYNCDLFYKTFFAKIKLMDMWKKAKRIEISNFVDKEDQQDYGEMEKIWMINND